MSESFKMAGRLDFTSSSCIVFLMMLIGFSWSMVIKYEEEMDFCSSCLITKDWEDCLKCLDSEILNKGDKTANEIVEANDDTLEEIKDLSKDLAEEYDHGILRLSSCKCCLKTWNKDCCDRCNEFTEPEPDFTDKLPDKRSFETVFEGYGARSRGCQCCQLNSFSTYCCASCLQRRK